MKSPFRGIQFRTMLSYFILAIAIIVAYKFIMEINAFIGHIQWLFNVISPFALGFLLAYILNIPCNGIQKIIQKSKIKFIYNKGKILSIIMTYALMFLTIYLIVRLVAPSITKSIVFFTSNFNSYYLSAHSVIDYLNGIDMLGLSISTDKILVALREFSLQQLPTSINAIFSFSMGLFNVFLALISSFYILMEKENFKKYLDRVIKVFFPHGAYTTIIRYAQNLNTNFKQYIYTQTIDGCILGTIATIELFLLKSPYALILGIMLGIVNYIPYFGSIFGSIFTILLVAFTQGFTTAAITAIVLLITQQIDANIIQPRLMSGSFSLSPLLVIIGISIGGALYGVLGMIVAIPIVSIVKQMIEEVILYYENRKLAELE